MKRIFIKNNVRPCDRDVMPFLRLPDSKSRTSVKLPSNAYHPIIYLTIYRPQILFSRETRKNSKKRIV